MATRNRKAANDQAAQQLQAGIRRLGKFEHVSAHAQRGHLVVLSGDDAWPVARVTPLALPSQIRASRTTRNGFRGIVASSREWRPDRLISAIVPIHVISALF
jgi:hypothetical protein